jgi:hypothetical protein
MELNKPLTIDERAEHNRVFRKWTGEAVGDKPDEMDYAMARIVMAWGQEAKRIREEDERWLRRTAWVIPFYYALVTASLVLAIFAIIQAL